MKVRRKERVWAYFQFGDLIDRLSFILPVWVRQGVSLLSPVSLKCVCQFLVDMVPDEGLQGAEVV